MDGVVSLVLSLGAAYIIDFFYLTIYFYVLVCVILAILVLEIVVKL